MVEESFLFYLLRNNTQSDVPRGTLDLVTAGAP